MNNSIQRDGTDKPLFFDSQVKMAAQELIKQGVIEVIAKAELYWLCLRRSDEINLILAPLDLMLRLDETRGLAFLVLLDGELADEWQHPLVRRQRLNLEQSLMVAVLRQHFVAHELEAGVGDQKARVDLDDLLPQWNQFLGASGSDERDDKRVRLLLEQLKGYGLVSEIDQNDKVTIRPLIAHIANPENLQNLINALKKHVATQAT